MPTLYLIDGYAAFFRAYHAIRTPMTSPVTKEPTNMTFGFVGMLLKLLRADAKATPNLARAGRPDFLAVALDVSGDRGTFRSQIYPEYKAQRPDPPEDLFPQVERCLAMLKAIGVPVLGAEGFEADDVMATLVTRLRAEQPDLRIRLVSKDKDLKQLLESVPRHDGTDAVVELFDVHTDAAFSAESLQTETGLRPSQVIDMLALMGDSVDNVPGVEGVGEKTAAALIKEWGTISTLLEHAHEIKGKRGEKIREAAAQLELSRSLVTLRRDVPVEFRMDDSSVARLDLSALIPILKELGFNRYQDEVRALTGQATGQTPGQTTLPNTGPGARERSSAGSSEGTRALDFMQPGVERPPPRAQPRPDPGFQGGLFDHVTPPSGEPRKAQSGAYRAITTTAQLSALMAELRRAEVISIDTETTSLSPRDAKLCGISLSVNPGTGVYIPLRSPEPDSHLAEAAVLEALRPILEDPKRPKCGHNLKYDIQVLREAGVRLRGLEAPGSCDSMVASYLLDASRSSHGLDSLALALLGRTNISITELIGSGKEQRTFDTVPVALATEYAAEDADVALQLRAVMMPQLEDAGLMPLMQGVEMPLVEVLAELEHNGILVDPGELERQRTRLAAKIEEILARLHSESFAAIGRRFDPDSPKQLSGVLFNPPDADPPGLGLKSIKKTKTGHSTDAEVLEKLADDATILTPIPRLILDYRQLSKLVSTYLVALKEAIHPRTRRVHTSFSQTVAATGRLASSDPNLQNIPIRSEVGRDIRRAFIAPPGRVLITADYSQIELRLLAHLSRDPALIEAFRQGEDIHAAVAAQIHAVPIEKVTKEQRGGAKMVNFGIVYGITAYGLARRLNIDEKPAAEIITQYKKRFAGITTFLQECVEQARAKGYVETMLKRRRPIPDVDSTNPSRRALAERLAINSVVQGSAADLIKLAMVDLHRRLTKGEGALHGVLMLLQIHDELVFEAPETTAPAANDLLVARMEQAMDLQVPLKADAHIAKNWHEGK
jgi:DNA polymerase-1